MKKYAVAIAAMFVVYIGYAQNEQEVTLIQSEITRITSVQKKIQNDLDALRKQDNEHTSLLNNIQKNIEHLNVKSDSLGKANKKVQDIQVMNYSELSGDIKQTNESFTSYFTATDSRITQQMLYGGALLLITILGFGVYLFIRRRSDSTSMDEVRKAQEALQSAQTKMQEDSVKLDNQMLVLVEKQMNAVPVVATQSETDHSLALKVADEIVRIEINLSRMDANVKGYRQLSRAVERIKNNFQANGYEIVDMLGKPYNEGMRVIANFAPDDTLAEGEQKITGITKPQINYNGIMIQKAQVTVSQNI